MKELIISIQDERPLSCIDSKSVQKHHTSEDTLYSKNMPSLKMGANVHSPQQLQRVLQWHPPWGASIFTLFTIKALLHCATPVQSTKYGRVDRNSTSLFGTQRDTKHIGRQTQWQTPTYTFDGRNKLDLSMVVDTGCRVAVNNRACSMSVDVTMPDSSS